MKRHGAKAAGTRAVAIVGGGPAGLMAAEALCARGLSVDLYDAMPSPGRKFLMAGKSGLNLTHTEPLDDFVSRFTADGSGLLETIIRAFPPTAIEAWAQGLGIATFTGTSGRVFPAEMKAAPLLRAWVKRLRSQGLRLHARHRWTGWRADGGLTFQTPDGEVVVQADAVILAVGGASWPKLGSDGAWVDLMAGQGVRVSPLTPSNCGFDVAWSEHLRQRFQGHPVKGVTLSVEDHAAANQSAGDHAAANFTAKGDCVITGYGLEGGPVYTLSAALRRMIERDGPVTLRMDLTPDLDAAALVRRLSRPRGKTSRGNHLRKMVGLSGVKAALLHEGFGAGGGFGASFGGAGEGMGDDPVALAARIKALPIRLARPRPIAEAISSAGGVAWQAVSDELEIRAMPGVFVAGEMLDWDAPTGGYLLSGCLATGRWAGAAVARRLIGA